MQIRSRVILPAIMACAALASAGCEQIGSIDHTPNQSESATKPNKLLGTWQVSQINGNSVSVMPPISLELKATELEASSGCIRWVWDIRRSPSKVIVDNMRPIPVCERGRTQEEMSFLDIMKTKPRITDEGGDLLIAGEAGSALASHNSDER